MTKKTNKFDYPHPLNKNLYQTKSYTPQNIAEYLKQKPTFYDTNYTFSPSIKTLISPKLLRISNTKIIPDQKFGILMQPFCQTQEVEVVQRSCEDQQLWKCKICHSLMNYQCESISLYEVNCKVCKNAQSISLDVKNTLENVPSCYEICSDHLESEQSYIEKNVCFVIEASQFNHNFRVSEVIQSCLASLKSTLPTQEMQRKFSQAATEDEESNSCQNNEVNSLNLKELTQYNISFIMFNDQHIFLINQTTNDVMVFNESFLQTSSASNTQSVIKFEDFFKPIEQISEQTFELISQILYESYLKSTSCLDGTIKFIHEWVDKYLINSQANKANKNLNQNMKRQVEYKFFVNTLKFTKSLFTQNSSSLSNGLNSRQIFSNVSNMITSNVSSSKNTQRKSTAKPLTTQTEESAQSVLTLHPNFSFFYLPHYHTTIFHSVKQREVIKKLNNNLYKMYPQTQDRTPKNKMDLFNQLYYDLFENLSSKHFFNVKVNIICSEKVEILAVGNQCLGYNDCSSGLVKTHSASKTEKTFNSYTVTLNCLQSTNTLPIDVKILPSQGMKSKKQPLSQTQHYIQVKLQYTRALIADEEPHLSTFQRVFHLQVTSLNRAINYQHHIYASLSTYVDDQTLFYFKLRWILSECQKTKTNHTIFKKLYQDMQKISENFKNEYGQMDFHKQYVRIFLYAFMIMNKPIINGINQGFYYERHSFLKGSPQCITKSIYPRTYEINNGSGKVELKNVKSSPKNFRSDSLLLLDNGKFLYFIIGEDNSVQDLKKIFGTCFIDEIRQMTELPELQTNEAYREAIDLARSNHESNFLPLKIMQLFSRQFDDEVSHLLYIKDNHFKYMRQLWEMEPVPKKVR